jgi:hypothetical protein
MHRKALIAIAVGSILGAAAHAAGEQPAAMSNPDSQVPPAAMTGTNGQAAAPQTSAQTSSKSTTQVAGTGTQPTTAADGQIAQDQRAMAHDQRTVAHDQKDIRYDRAKIGQNEADIRSDRAAEKATGVNDQAQIAQDKTNIRTERDDMHSRNKSLVDAA